MDIQVKPNQEFYQEIPKQWNCLFSIYEGKANFGKQQKEASKGQAVFFELDNNTTLKVKTGNESVGFMLMAGKPLNEPIY